MRIFEKVLLTAVAIIIAGCAGGAAMKRPAPGAYIEGVPFFSQDEYMCGPAALASVMGYHGQAAGMIEVAKEVYSVKLKGTLPMDLLIFAKQKGFEAKYYKGSLEDLKTSLARKEPLILFLNLGYSFYPVGHYVVAVGMSDDASVVFAHSGTEKEKAFEVEELDKAWSRTGYSTLQVKPKARQE